jgi:hypothetical protein
MELSERLVDLGVEGLDNPACSREKDEEQILHRKKAQFPKITNRIRLWGTARKVGDEICRKIWLVCHTIGATPPRTVALYTVGGNPLVTSTSDPSVTFFAIPQRMRTSPRLAVIGGTYTYTTNYTYDNLGHESTIAAAAGTDSCYGVSVSDRRLPSVTGRSEAITLSDTATKQCYTVIACSYAI